VGLGLSCRVRFCPRIRYIDMGGGFIRMRLGRERLETIGYTGLEIWEGGAIMEVDY